MAQVPYAMWADYYELLLLRQGVEPVEILDVCCGTGTVAELLAEKGFKVTGFDLSAPMIESATAKEEQQQLGIRYFVADAAEFDAGQTFDGAFSFFDSLNYITDPERLRMALHRVAAHLRPGGSFIFDLNTAYAFEADLFTQKEKRKNAAIRYDWVGHYDRATKIIRVDMTFWKGDEELHETHVQRAYGDEEIRDYLAEAGFIEVEAFHSYSLDRPRPKSDRVHYCARTPS